MLHPTTVSTPVLFGFWDLTSRKVPEHGREWLAGVTAGMGTAGDRRHGRCLENTRVATAEQREQQNHRVVPRKPRHGEIAGVHVAAAVARGDTNSSPRRDATGTRVLPLPRDLLRDSLQAGTLGSAAEQPGLRAHGL